MIECLSLTKRYRSGLVAVDDLNLRVETGQVYGFLGPNGAGKTTTIRLMLDLIRPTAGEVRVFGQPVQRNPAALRQVGAFVEGSSFYPYLSGWDNLRVIGQTLGKFEAQRARRLLESLGLADKLRERVGRYSTGMKQRLGIAAALLHDPPIVILDEPANGLDPKGIHRMRSYIRALADEHGKTVFLSSHQLGEVQQICDRVAILDKGKLIAEGRVQDLLTAKRQIMIEAQPIEKAHAILAEYQPVMGEKPDTLMVSIPHEAIPALVRRLVLEKIDLYAMQPHGDSLEDLFFALVKSETL